MRFQYLVYTIIILLGFMGSKSHAQGCSDAGACSIGSLEWDGTVALEPPKLKISLDQNLALGEKFTFISLTAFTVEHRFLDKTSYIIRVPFIFTAGNLGNSSGVGDVMVSIMQQWETKNHTQWALLGGVKLRSNHSGFSFGGSPLPMAYQTSMGTYDVIIGAQYMWKSWDIYMAYQHPFGRNENQYLNDPVITDPDKIYFESAQLKRGDDLALRGQKLFSLKHEQGLQPGIMAIYRIQKSEIIKADEPVILDGSNGLTLNLFLNYIKTFENQTSIYLTLAFPVIDRDYRADGLTRNVILNFRISKAL